MVGRLDAGEDVVVVRQANRIEAAARLPGTDRAYVYASRDTNVPGFQQSARASAVLADYNSLFERSQLLQLRFNGALYLGSLLLLALAVIAAIVVADRIVRPLGTLIGATRTAAEGDRSEEHTSELQSLMRISYAVFCLKKKSNTTHKTQTKSTN